MTAWFNLTEPCNRIMTHHPHVIVAASFAGPPVSFSCPGWLPQAVGGE